MGGTLSSVFSSTGAGPNGNPTAAQNIGQGLLKGSALGFGSALQQQPQPQGGMGVQLQAPMAAPVDPRFFLPMGYGS